MCGIAGYQTIGRLQTGGLRLLEMGRILRHRGPDDEGFVLINSDAGTHLDLSGSESDSSIRSRLPSIEDHGRGFPHDIAFAHRRFSIIDLSPDGHQPMWDAQGQVCVSFYGEIYNYVELRDELEAAGVSFRTRSDTEVILQSYLHWGTDALRRFNGPFAIALYDSDRKALLLARDRIGKSTFYYAIQDGSLFWASEIKAILHALGSSSFSVNDQAIHDFVSVGLRDFDGTFWNEVSDFPPGCFAWIGEVPAVRPEPYWTIPDRRLATRDLGRDDAAAELRRLLSNANRIRVRADVPVAFELSGGMDSSTLVALAATQLPQRITTFTVKNSDPDFDEEPYARSVFERYRDRLDHKVLVQEDDDFWRNADAFVWNQEEPFHSPNLQTNQHLRRLMHADGCRVVITGAAGDEVLAGYVWDYIRPYLRHLLAGGDLPAYLRELTSNTEFDAGRGAGRLAAMSLLPHWAIELIRKARGTHGADLRGLYENPRAAGRKRGPAAFSDMMIENMGAWKMNYWLRSGSKASFAIPIEARTPFLDPDVVDFCFRLPPEYLIHEGWHKWVLRRAVEDILPADVVWRRRKMGFPFPLRQWLVDSFEAVSANVAGVDCPYVNADRLKDSYHDLVRSTPETLWRLISLMLWWRRVVEGRAIVGAAGATVNAPAAALGGG